MPSLASPSSEGTLGSVVRAAVTSAATAWGFYLMAKFVNHRWHVVRLEKELDKLQKLVEHERNERRAERQGRIRAEQEMRRQRLLAVAAASGAGAAPGAGVAVGAALGSVAEGEEGEGEEVGVEASGSGEPESAAEGSSSTDGAAQCLGGEQRQLGTGGAGREGVAAAAGATAQGGPGTGANVAHIDPDTPCASGAVTSGGEARGGGLSSEAAGSGAGTGRGQGRREGGKAGAGASASGKGAADASSNGPGASTIGGGGGSSAGGGGGGGVAGGLTYPLRPIGVARSCFSQRNGTPRQPLLVPLARCRVQLAPDVPGLCLQGLQQYSHAWVVYLFHENTDLVKLWQGDRSGVKAKVHVPRLNGEKMGVLATRSPHRPLPIGLSVAQVISVDASGITLGGADIVDGSPVLDIKPYLPFVDSVPQASAPSWVTVEAEDEPLRVSTVACEVGPAALIQSCWEGMYGAQQAAQAGQAVQAGSLYRTSTEFLDLVKQVLARDIRPVHRRIQSPLWSDVPAPPPNYYEGTQPPLRVGAYHVVLEGVDVSYDIDEKGSVELRGACPNVVQSQQRGLGLLGG